jgi:hypothetical protein
MSVTKVTSMMSTGTKGGDIPSASTLVIDTDGDFFDITGTTGITAMTVDAGRRFTLQFDGALTLTHGSSLYLPGATNFTTEANDSLDFIATAANTVRCTSYALKDGGSVVAPSSGITSYISSFSYDQSTTGSVAVTGVGFTPNVIIAHTVQAASPEASTGFGNAGDEHALRFDHNNSAESLSWSDSIGQVLQSGSISCRWNIASFDADGFTYTKTKSGSSTGTNKVLYLAIK